MSYIICANNVHAARSVFDLSNYEVVHSAYNPDIICRKDGVDTSPSIACAYDTGGMITRIYTSGLNWSFKKGDLVEFDIIVWSDILAPNTGVSLYFGSGVTFANFLLIEVTETINDQYYHLFNDISTGALYNQNAYSHVYHVVGQILNDYTGDVGLYGNNNYPIFAISSTSLDTLRFRISNLATWRYVGSEDNKEVADATQDAADDSENTSQSASQDASNASQNLLSAIGSVTSALTSAPATDCKIDISTRQFSIGQVNLCSGVPQNIRNTVSTIVALVFTPIVLYYCYNIVTTLYGLFKEYNS